MSKRFFQNNYIAGDVVYAKTDPGRKLVIRRYIDQVYYCNVEDNREGRELVYFERELVEDRKLAAENKKARMATK
ncbi:hypothetical protein [Fulvivirga sedimenti]|jgi:hypothetical protein|uniref:Uncharacterized protein n=1 Tax=Fulvivirga sedimenti TaxID=2879465 RepID=A0A9X1KYD1_9BACT|nr:hypothetical protein [Fulvivirga sedimenti]MCA6074650.1 hypothetical protein [Fulvivirga sedimenti]MCA6075827.1 hypothetical protein [Fulvivirga sedimenti]MCA6076955.1 hypothetical protein [Fulvivirga sedimenti]